ncbi:MAG: hypothetical protein ABJC05_12520, partial [Pyrinomonadaceae bacterium]
VEAGTPSEVFNNPQQEETRAFMKSFQEEEPAPSPAASGDSRDPQLETKMGTRDNLGQEE